MKPRLATQVVSGTIFSLAVAALGYGCVIGFVNAVGHSPRDARGPLPGLRVEPEIHELGRLAAGPRVEAVFRVTNTGARRLILQKQSNSCGCLSADPEINIPPGHTRRIAAALHTDRLRGPVQLEISYRTNDPHCPKLKLTLLADVVAADDPAADGQPLLPIPAPTQQAAVESQPSASGS